MKRLIRAVIVILCLAILTHCAFAASSNSLIEEYGDMWQKIEDLDWERKKNREQQEAAIAEAEDYLRRMEEAKASLNLTQEQIDELEAQMASLEEQYAHSANEYEALRDKAATRLNVEFQQRNQSKLDMIFGCGSLLESLRMIFLGVEVSDKDAELMEELAHAREDLQIKHDLLYENKLALSVEAAGQEAGVDEILAKYNEAEDRRRDMESLYLALTNMEDELLEQSEQISKRIQEAQAAEEAERSRKAAERNAQQTAAGTEKSEGEAPVPTKAPEKEVTSAFIWPTPGYPTVSSPFGYRLHPIQNVWKLHTGIDIGAAGGSNILASASGTVLSSGWQSGYGNCVVIDHGNGYSTLYAHASKLLVYAGQRVSQGQVIALVGSTGQSTGNHLHFEVRVNGSVQNPLNYVTPR